MIKYSYIHFIYILLANDVGRGAHNFMLVKAAFVSAYQELEDILNGTKQIDGPILKNIIIIPESIIEFRRKVNTIPYNILRLHPGNASSIFGGQPPYGHNGPYHPSLFVPPVSINGTLLSSHNGVLIVPQPITVSNNYDEAADQQNQTINDNCTSPTYVYNHHNYDIQLSTFRPSLNSNSYNIPQFVHPHMFNFYSPQTFSVPINMIHQQPPPYYDGQDNSSPEEEDYFNDESSSGESTPNSKRQNANLMSSNSSTTSTDTSCTTVTPDCNSDKGKSRLSNSSSDSALSD